MTRKIKFTPVAVDDIDEAFSYITSENAFAAKKLLDQLDHQISMLAEFPHMGSVLPDEDYNLVKHGYRFIVVHPYLVFYRINQKSIVIYRVLHGKRDYLRELFTP